MSPVFLPPSHVSLFSQPKTPRWLEAPLFVYVCIVAGVVGFIAKQFGTIAFYHPHAPHAVAGMIVAGVCFFVSMAATFTAGKSFLSLIRKS